jgi:cobalt-zinc-cadmium efflux system outer membrane protein
MFLGGVARMPDMQIPQKWAISRTWLTAKAILFFALGIQTAAAQQSPPSVRIDLEQAIQMAVAHNHSLKAARTQIQQSEAEEITAALRPNPVFTYDDLYVPIFNPGQFTANYLDSTTEFDLGISYTIERGHKRQARIQAAKDQTSVTRSQVSDTERGLTFNVAQQFVGILLAKSTLQFANQDLASYQQTVNLSSEQYRAGAISEGDLLKIKLQLLQFQMDVSQAQLSLVQASASLRALLGYDAIPVGYEVVGDLAYEPLKLHREDLQLKALQLRPDYLAAQRGVTAAQSQYSLAKANGKRDLTALFDYTHVSSTNNAGLTLSIEIPVFDKNQGEIARTNYAIGQAQETKTAAQETVMTDVANAYEAFRIGDQVMQLYLSGYLQQAQDSRDISEYAYKRGAASLLDFLDAERSYRATQLAYRQALATYMLAIEQLREVVGTRKLQ